MRRKFILECRLAFGGRLQRPLGRQQSGWKPIHPRQLLIQSFSPSLVFGGQALCLSD